MIELMCLVLLVSDADVGCIVILCVFSQSCSGACASHSIEMFGYSRCSSFVIVMFWCVWSSPIGEDRNSICCGDCRVGMCVCCIGFG